MLKTYDEVLRLVNKINFYKAISKGENMNNYSIDSAVSDKVVSAYTTDKEKKELDDLAGTINKINNSFGLIDIPDYNPPEFSKMDSISKSNEEISAEAKNSLEEYRRSALEDIDSSINAKKSSLENSKSSLKSSKDDAISSVSAAYSKSRDLASNDALKRGLARSSIVVSVLDAFSKDELDTISRIEKDYADNLNAINFELNALGLQREQAIKDFDVAYAVKLNDKINSLANEYQKKEQEIIKYNNEIAEKEKEYQDSYNKLVADIKEKNIDSATKQSELVSKYGSKAISNYTKNQVFAVLDNYLLTKDRNDRIAILTSDAIKNALGSNYEEAYSKYIG